MRRSLVGLGGVLLGLALMATVGRSDEVAVRVSAPTTGFVIHDADQTLRDYCAVVDGALWLVLPGGARFELVTSTCELPNPGDGSFHPFDEVTVCDALQSVRYSIGRVGAEVFLLPYPRRDGTESAAGPGVILLSPGVVPLGEQQQHAAVVHELGHVIQYQYMPDQAVGLWDRYRELRGITDEQRYSPDSPHADRPHEIFAEDFRALFGDALANYSGTIENASLCPPRSVQGLDSFLASLSGLPVAGGDLRGFPNPTRGALSFRRGSGPAEPLDLFDLSGRRVATLAPTPLAQGWQWGWDGRDNRGNPVPAGVLFARERGSVETLRFVVAR